MDGIDIGGLGGAAAQNLRLEASMTVLSKAMKADAGAMTTLLDAMPAPGTTGSLGRNVDVRA